MGVTWPPHITALLASYGRYGLFECVAGSRAYALATPESDEDRRGIFALPAAAYLGLTAPPDQLADERGDRVFYSLRRFAQLAAAANPNILEVLFCPDELVRHRSPCIEPLFAARGRFLSRRCAQTYLNYARAQIRKARGQNKWINRPQPRQPPTREAFCWVIRRGPNDAPPFRPQPLAETGIDLAQCHVATLEHVPDAYRLYHYGPQARGVFRDGNLVVESIALEDEHTRCIGLLIFRRDAYERAKRDHAHYWRWRRERNPERWRAQETGDLDFDAKNLMHTFRLLLSGAHLLEHGEPKVRFAGAERAFLMAIRAGRFDFATLVAEAEARLARLTTLEARASLPEAPDVQAIEDLVRAITADWEHRVESGDHTRAGAD